MRKLFIISLFLIAADYVNTQKIEIKDNDVLLDGNLILN